jgi:hypothetical protein
MIGCTSFKRLFVAGMGICLLASQALCALESVTFFVQGMT